MVGSRWRYSCPSARAGDRDNRNNGRGGAGGGVRCAQWSGCGRQLGGTGFGPNEAYLVCDGSSADWGGVRTHQVHTPERSSVASTGLGGGSGKLTSLSYFPC